MNHETRITELETRLAFQDDTIQALNDVVVEQQRTLDLLSRQLELLAGRQEELLNRFEIESDVPPPHY
ncbi:SlyX family protein [Stutzerimonas tarimensis]|uniref:Protein SlyX homolog n=1 Tax=Stutzerimonas tarimensis TaxID=1507735 RepID=A0ABV7T6Z3_9GAMM